MRVVTNPSQYLLASISGMTELPYCAELVYHPPTYECPEEGSYEIQYSRAFTLRDQETGYNLHGMQQWWFNEFVGEVLIEEGN